MNLDISDASEDEELSPEEERILLLGHQRRRRRGSRRIYFWFSLLCDVGLGLTVFVDSLYNV